MAHLSRHFNACDARKVRWIPFVEPRLGGGAQVEEELLEHKLIALGGYDQDEEQHQLCVLDLQVTTPADGGAVRGTSLQPLASWEHTGEVRALEVAQLGGGLVCLLAGSSTGCLARLQMQLPTAPGSQPDEIQLVGSDVDGPALRPWLPGLHRGPLAGLSHLRDGAQLATVGMDGRIQLVRLDDTSPPSRPWYEGGEACSFIDVCWCSPDTFVTASTQGGLHCWDQRAGPKSSAVSPPAWGLAGTSRLDRQQGLQRRFTCLAVHSSQPNAAVSGSTCGAVAVWDLRFGRQPAVWSLPDSAGGDVHEVRFASSGGGGFGGAAAAAGAGPVALCCSEGGAVAHTAKATQGGFSAMGQRTASGEGGEAALLYREPAAAVRSFDVDSTGGGIVAATSQECLVYLRQLQSQQQ